MRIAIIIESLDKNKSLNKIVGPFSNKWNIKLQKRIQSINLLSMISLIIRLFLEEFVEPV